MQIKTSIFIDESVWRKFRILCLTTGVPASARLEALMRRDLKVVEKNAQRKAEAA
jgi:hypothetical protein